MRSFFRFAASLSLACLAACGTTTSSAGSDDAGTSSDTSGSDTGSDASSSGSIFGTWASSFGGYSEISNSAWDGALVIKWDPANRWVITQNASNDPYNPAAFNKLVWTEPKDGSFYYCTVDYGLVTAQMAEDTTKTADASAPDKSGCGGFSWTKLTATDAIAIAGKYNDNFGGKSVISSTHWDAAWMAKFDNGKRYAITQNPADDKYSPNKFQKLVWTAPQAGSFYVCTVDYGLDSADLAEATTKTADDATPDKSGCGGFSWTKLTPQ
jgi:hypothetical protein